MTTIDSTLLATATAPTCAVPVRTRHDIQREARRGAAAESVTAGPGRLETVTAGPAPTRRDVQREARRSRRGATSRGATGPTSAREADGAVDRAVSLLAVILVLLALASIGWQAMGGRLLMMSTQSMCPGACVGSLVVDDPPGGTYRAGELISFQPPGSSETYTHRIISVEGGVIRTKGDANLSADPWTLTASQVTGRVDFTLWGAGWLYRVLPLLVIGAVAAAFVRPRLRHRNRGAYLTMWLAALAVVPALIVRPFARGALLDAVPDPHHKGWVLARLVNTGLLPTRLAVVHGQSAAVVSPSRITTLAGPLPRSGYLPVAQWVVLPWWGWSLVALLVTSPLVVHVGSRLALPAPRTDRGARGT